jgi:hypothetical protein
MWSQLLVADVRGVIRQKLDVRTRIALKRTCPLNAKEDAGWECNFPLPDSVVKARAFQPTGEYPDFWEGPYTYEEKCCKEFVGTYNAYVRSLAELGWLDLWQRQCFLPPDLVAPCQLDFVYGPSMQLIWQRLSPTGGTFMYKIELYVRRQGGPWHYRANGFYFSVWLEQKEVWRYDKKRDPSPWKVLEAACADGHGDALAAMLAKPDNEDDDDYEEDSTL